MQVGICGSLDQMQSITAAGADFLEANIRSLTSPENLSWGAPITSSSWLPIPTANSFIAPEIRLTGNAVDPQQQDHFVQRVLSRAADADVKLIVFGSGGARNVPDEFSMADAYGQLIDFARRAATFAAVHRITIVVEPLNKSECNIVNTLADGARIVEAVDHPNLQLLLDTYHFWLEDDSLAELKRRLPMIRHVHVADKIGRLYPGESGEADYRPMFALLKSTGYDGRISIEAATPASPDVMPRSIEYVRRVWRDA